jgi:hypothetical protein
MVERIEKWTAADGTMHDTYEAAVAYEYGSNPTQFALELTDKFTVPGVSVKDVLSLLDRFDLMPEAKQKRRKSWGRTKTTKVDIDRILVASKVHPEFTNEELALHLFGASKRAHTVMRVKNGTVFWCPIRKKIINRDSEKRKAANNDKNT